MVNARTRISWFRILIFLFILLFVCTSVLVPDQPDIRLPGLVAGAGEVTGGRVPGRHRHQVGGHCEGVLLVMHDGLAIIRDPISLVKWIPFEVKQTEQLKKFAVE